MKVLLINKIVTDKNATWKLEISWLVMDNFLAKSF